MKWEYKIIYLQTYIATGGLLDVEELMKSITFEGNSGWELCDILYNQKIGIFKRRVSDQQKEQNVPLERYLNNPDNIPEGLFQKTGLGNYLAD